MTFALYIHVPFCLRRCTYCDFNTYAGLLSLRPAYVQALLGELTLRAAQFPAPATSVYFGGGTPSLLPAADVRRLLDAVRDRQLLADGAEITLEANPGTVDLAALRGLRQAGVNRLSFGVQSAQDAELRMLGRIHTWDEAVQAVRQARRAGFTNLSLDLIFGLPGQTLAAWQDTLNRTLDLAPAHLSLYALSVEEGTPLAASIAEGTLPAPDPDLAAAMYELAGDALHRAGFWQYEISNWARGHTAAPEIWALPPGGQSENIGPVSRHNLSYWRNTPWLGLGAGAHSWLAGRRHANVLHPRDYIRLVQAGELPEATAEAISRRLEQGETMMMGLRLAEGVGAARFQARFGVSLAAVYGATLRRWQDWGLLHWDGDRARLTARGRLLGNQVFGAFLPDDEA